jgi:KUP system potassium uptake protein
MATPTLATKPTIRIADTQRPSRSRTRTIDNGENTASGSGVYNIRAVSRSGTLRTRRSFDTRSLKEERQDDDAALGEEGDFKKKQVFTGRYLLWLAYQSTGVIYGEYVLHMI